MNVLRAVCFASLAAVSGCASMAPEYARPEPPVPGAWPGAAAATSGAASLAEVPWREFFVDERLQQVLALALGNNRDLRIAALNIEKSRAQYQIQSAEFVPEVSGAAAGNLQRVAADFSSTGSASNLHQYTVGLGFTSYELDFFGRVRSLKDKALEQYLATEHAQRAARIGLVYQVAAAWLALAADRERLQVARDTFASQEETVRIVRARFGAGISSALDLAQARTSLEYARADIARYSTLVAQDENALVLAVGCPVPAALLPASLTESLTALEELAPGLPSEVLLRRPDVLQAEGNLRAANANIGAARAALFPSITLTSAVGLGSNELNGLFESGSTTWKFIPAISLPIFDGGANRATLDAAVVARDIAVAQYEKAIQTAFQEVADALAQRATIDEQLAARRSLVAAADESLRLSRARYEQGIDGYLTVLESVRSLYLARQALVSTHLTRLGNQATLYKVLGGGSVERP